VSEIGFVAIGRNEGERLRRCLDSLCAHGATIVYVDSGSSDDSVQVAQSLGADVVELDMSAPFSAARARNAGFARLMELSPEARYVQFLDGDCELASGWLGAATADLEGDARLAVVAGRRRERFPERTIYNRLCDLEWDTPIGPAKACGGDALVRVSVFDEVGGYDPAVIAGEEPEMCVRLRAAGWLVARIDAEMTLHDADMTRLGQWWKRVVRSGHAYAEGAAMHGSRPERHYVRESASIWLWGAVLPMIAVALAWPTGGYSLLLFLAYVLIAARVFRGQRRRGRSASDGLLYALFVVMGKFPQVLGQWKYFAGRALGRKTRLIEYKPTGAPRPVAAESISRGCAG
jgi:glycosyltransferase involved in cell wall biosynthesis